MPSRSSAFVSIHLFTSEHVGEAIGQYARVLPDSDEAKIAAALADIWGRSRLSPHLAFQQPSFPVFGLLHLLH